jgi:uncharacterized protein (DUF927 family)
VNSKLNQELKLRAIVEDEASHDFFAQIEFRDIYGRLRRVHRSRAELDDLKALKKALINAGALFSDDEDERSDALLALRAQAKKAPKRSFASRLGWHDDRCRRFVRPRGVIGTNPDKELRPPRERSARILAMRTAGTHKEWVKEVARPAAYSSRMVLAICTAFAAPLLKLANAESFAIYLTGPSTVGKSTVTLAAGSVVGFGTAGDLPTFRATNAGLAELCAEFNDSVLPLDEFGMLEGSANERRRRQRELTFGFAGGQGKTYSKFASCHRSASGWRSIILANGEEESDVVAMNAGEIRIGGEQKRWMEVPALQKDQPDVFDLAPTFDSPDKRTKWFVSQCATIREACRRNHGVAHWHFIEGVIKKSAIVRAEVGPLRDFFAKKVAKGETDQVVRHLAKNFGLIYAAGITAARLHTVPWSEKSVLNAVRRCYRAARRNIKTEADLLRVALLRLQERIADPAAILPAEKTLSPTRLVRADGYWGKGATKDTITVRARAFKDWFDDPRHAKLVLDFLRGQGCLPGKSKSPSRGTAIVWAETQPQWPDHSRPRSIVMRLKRTLFEERSKKSAGKK